MTENTSEGNCMNTPSSNLTVRQAEVLEFIRANSAYYGPSVRQIAQAFGIKSPNGVVCHLQALERKGRIKRHAGQVRGIEVIA